MWNVTGWAFLTWLKTTVVLAVVVGVAWLLLPAGSVWLPAVVVAAALVEVFVARQLSREWRHEASLRWWWNR